jgi:hypothetical protein
MSSNIGEVGAKSSRFAGKSANELSVVQRMQARKGIELTEKQQRRKDIKDKYPPYKVPNMEAAIREAHANIGRFQGAIKKEQQTINEFTAHLALCRQRDKELRAAGFDPL